MYYYINIVLGALEENERTTVAPSSWRSIDWWILLHKKAPRAEDESQEDLDRRFERQHSKFPNVGQPLRGWGAVFQGKTLILWMFKYFCCPAPKHLCVRQEIILIF